MCQHCKVQHTYQHNSFAILCADCIKAITKDFRNWVKVHGPIVSRFDDR